MSSSLLWFLVKGKFEKREILKRIKQFCHSLILPLFLLLLPFQFVFPYLICRPFTFILVTFVTFLTFPSYLLLSTVLADNLKSNPGIKWQYFSSEEGIFTVFPAHKFQCKGSYEHRSR